MESLPETTGELGLKMLVLESCQFSRDAALRTAYWFSRDLDIEFFLERSAANIVQICPSGTEQYGGYFDRLVDEVQSDFHRPNASLSIPLY
jgi:hypothetical protein